MPPPGSSQSILNTGTPAGSHSEGFDSIRAASLALAAPLSPEDCTVQSMPDASPVKWHLAHTTWFFEQFVLIPHLAGYRIFDTDFSYLFNSYYEGVGPRHERARRGLLTRPSLAEVFRYRRHVDEAMQRLLARGAEAAVTGLVELGLQHEQQHQELLLMDIKHLLSCHPAKPFYALGTAAAANAVPDALPAESSGETVFRKLPPGIYEIGHGANGFSFDNETPRHRVYLESFLMAERRVTNAEYRDFIRDRGYGRPELWLSDGWATVQREAWIQPLYWDASLDAQFTLAGPRALDPQAPVCHISFYEADAFARWAGARLPTEAEWEIASAGFRWGDVWEHTGSAYLPYPGYRPAAGAIGEYNGKFMANQMVLRGGSRFTPPGHARTTYRNFFYPHMRWQLSGLRLAKDRHP